MQLLTYNAVIFDLGGVLIDIDYHATTRAFEALGIVEPDALYNQALQTTLFDQFETGQLSPQQFLNKLKTFVPDHVTPNQLVHAWNAMILDFPADKLDFLVKLRRHIPIYLLSNTNAIHEDKVRRALRKITESPLESFFDHVFLSHQIQHRKPHISTFEFVCREVHLTPSTTLFIDDSKQHIEGAKSIGLNTMLFPQNASFESTLFLA